jgi:phage gpG-like protein
MIAARIIGTDATLLSIRSFGLGIKERVREAVEKEAIRLTRYVKEMKLSGQVLKNRTGTLRRKINYRITETETTVVASVGVKLSYAAAHEYGFDGVVDVKEHLREVRMAWGRPITPVQAVVRAHTMHMHVPERSFLRSSLRENAPSIREALAEAVRRPT